MCGTWIDEVTKRQLMDVSEPLKRLRIDYFSLVTTNADERMDWIPKLMRMLQGLPQYLRYQVGGF